MNFSHFEDERRFRAAWDAVTIERASQYSLFTFGESVLPYLLVCGARPPEKLVSLTRGEVRIARPMIVTPDNAQPQFRNFFENAEEEGLVQFLLARTAAFSHLKFENQKSPAQLLSDDIEETVARLNRQLDAEEEDRVAILTAPATLGGVAVLRYAAERVWASGPGSGIL